MSSDRINIERALRAAEGYAELGMGSHALAELDSLGPDALAVPMVCAVRLQLLMYLRRWPEALTQSAVLCAMEAENTTHFVSRAFCLHELGLTREARECLMNGPVALLREAIYFYNMACYEAVLGNLEEAQGMLRKAFQMDKNFAAIARTDPDLRLVFDLI